MDAAQSSEARFVGYFASLAQVLGHADRAQPLNDYCAGLLAPGERKSVEPMAAVVAPSRVSAEHQCLLHFVAQAPWSDEALLNKVRELVLPEIEAQGGPIEAWIVDDTGFAKKGVHSVGVARQYCGRLGKTDNCQIAVTLSSANHAASLPIAYRLYLPEDWAKDTARRNKAHVPAEVNFKTKPQIACGGGCARRRAGGRGLWDQWRVSSGADADGTDLCRGRPIQCRRMAAGDRASPGEGLERARAAPIAATARRGPHPRLGESAGNELARRRLERRDLARGLQ
jgi:hypothetical protein